MSIPVFDSSSKKCCCNSCWKMPRSVTNLGKSKPVVEFVEM